MPHKRLALYVDSLSGGGAEKVVMVLADSLLSLGHQVHLFVLNGKTEYTIPNHYPVHFLSKGKTKGWFNRSQLAKKLRSMVKQIEASQGQFDLHLANLEECYRIVSACDFKQCFFVIHNSMQETLLRTRKLGPLKYAYLKYQLACLRGQHLITVSDGIKQELEQHRLIDAASIRRIYNPFAIATIRNMAAEPVTNKPDKYLIHVGRFAKQKRHDILFRALQQLPDEYKLVCLCGRDDKLQKLAAEYQLQGRVISPGFTQNPYPWIKHAELMLLSSDFEGFGNVLVESLICGTPVVSTDCPHGPNEILQGELANWLVPRRDPAALASKAKQALASDIDLENAAILKQIDHLYIAEQYLSLAKHPV